MNEFLEELKLRTWPGRIRAVFAICFGVTVTVAFFTFIYSLVTIPVAAVFHLAGVVTAFGMPIFMFAGTVSLSIIMTQLLLLFMSREVLRELIRLLKEDRLCNGRR